MSRRWFWWLFIGIVLLASALRLWQLGRIPVSLYWDEAAMYVDVKAVLATGQDVHGRPWYQLIYPSYGDYKLPVYIWAATAAAKLFGLSEFSLRLPSAIAGVLTVLIAGALARQLLLIGTLTKYKPKTLDIVQLFTMFVVAVSPWSLMFSRTGFEGHIGQMLLGLSALLAAWGLSKQKTWIFFLAPVVGAFATYSYYSVRFVWFVVFAGVCGLYLLQKYSSHSGTALKKVSSLRGAVLQMFAAAVVFVVCLLPLLNSPLAKDADRFRLGTDSVLNNDQLALQSNLYRELAGNTVIDRIFYHRLWLLARELFKNYSDNLSPSFLFINGDPNLRHGTGQFGLFYLILLPALLTGLAVLLKRHLPLALIIAAWWLAALLPASVPENTPHALRSLNALIPLSITIGFGVSWWWERIQNRMLHGLLLGLLIVSVVQFWWFYLAVYPAISANDWQSGYKPLAMAITQETAQGNTVYVQPFDDRFYLWLMGYGSYSGAEFQHWPTNDYKFVSTTMDSNFTHIEFKTVSDEELTRALNEGKKPFLAGKRQDITDRCAAATLYSCQIKIITDEIGVEKFVLAQLELK